MVSIRVLGSSLLGLSVVACTFGAPRQESTQQAPVPHILTQYQWERAAPSEGAHRHPLQLHFVEGRVLAGKLCNQLSAPYKVDGAQLSIEQFISTMKMCADPSLMQWEQFVAKHLPTVQDYVVAISPDSQVPTLTLTFKEGEKWTLKGHATPETKYGGPAERVFWEVAPEKVSCIHPLMGKTTCLRVREIQYNTTGVKTAVGEWENFHGTIEGHTFVPGQRQVLRLKRFTRQTVAADQSNHVYVLDLVVEIGSAGR